MSDQHKKTTSQDKTTKAKIKSESKEPKEKSSNLAGITGAILGILSLVGVGGLAVWNYKMAQSNQAIQDKLAYQQQLQTESQSAFEASATELKTLNIEQSKALAELNNQVQVQQQRLQGMSGQFDWRLSEAKYLVSIAIERLSTIGDIKTVIEQLKAANLRLKQVGDPRTVPIREIITQDIANLEVLSVPDKTDLWLEVGKLVPYINSLTVHSLQDAISKTPELEGDEKDDSDKKSTWKTAIKDSWSEIKELVKVRDFNAEALSLTLTKEEHQQLNQAIILQISQAQWAVINEAKGVYEQSLQNINDWLEKFYKKDEAFEKMKAHLTELQAKFVKKAELDLSKGLDAINNLIEDLAIAFLNSTPSQAEADV